MAKRILTVDDSSTIRHLLKMALLRTDYEVIQAADGEQALVKAGQDTFDFIFTDINMLKMDGIELVRRLRRLKGYSVTPIVVLTTESEVAQRQEAKEAGANGWMVKPFHPDQLIGVLSKLMPE